MAKGRSVIQNHARWKVGNENMIDFWKDHWADETPLHTNRQATEAESSTPLRVCDFIMDDRTWDMHKLLDVLPEDEVETIRAIPIPLKLLWRTIFTGLRTTHVSSQFVLLILYLQGLKRRITSGGGCGR